MNFFKMKCNFIFIFLFSSFFLFINTQGEATNIDEQLTNTYGKSDKVICVTIPKSGTHLLIKCLDLLDIDGITFPDLNNDDPNRKPGKKITYRKLTLEKYSDHTFSNLTRRIIKKNHFQRSFVVHLPYHEKYKFFFDQFTFKNFLMIRDPRDQLISAASTCLVDRSTQNDCLEEIMLDLLTGNQDCIAWERRHIVCDVLWSVGIVEFYKQFLMWSKEPNFLLVHYENLVGSKGGGSSIAQMEEIKKIAAHLGENLSVERLQFITNNLFSGTNTFKEGQTSSWKKYFNPKVKDAFKNIPGACQLLIDLGYEKDSNW